MVTILLNGLSASKHIKKSEDRYAMARKKGIGIIYCLTSPSNKKYVGQTKKELSKRIKQHTQQKACRIIYNAIQKYGIDSFKIEVLKECTHAELNQYEQFYIAELNTVHPNGYNIRTGGATNSLHCEESRKKMSESKKGPLNHNYGKPRTEQAKLNISKAKSGEKHHFFGKKFTDEHKLKVARSHRKREEDLSLPMYMVYVKPRPAHNACDGYAIVNHPTIRNKYFSSSKFTLEEKYQLCLDYLNSFSNV